MKKMMLLAVICMLSSSVFAQSDYAVSTVEVANEVYVEQIAPLINNTPNYFENVAPITNLEESQLLEMAQYLSGNPDRLTAGVLAILLGGIGVQHFYTGQTIRGILDICFCWTGIPELIGLIEGIIWLCEDDAAFQARVAGWQKNSQTAQPQPQPAN